jgi:cytochrome c
VSLDREGEFDRRQTLKCMLWAGTGVVWTVAGDVPASRLIGSAKAGTSGFSFVQISDSHIGFAKPANPDARVTLDAAIDKIVAMPDKPAFILHTGDHGEALYEACQDCHSLDKNDVGPRHRGVFGRKAASLPDYDYSDALKSANITWNEETLDKWLTDPQAVAPGAKMFFHLENPQDRADVIAYLKERAK